MIDSKSILRLVGLLGYLALAPGGVLAAQTIVGNLSLGDGPVAAAVDPVLGKVYIANHGSNTVTAVNEYANSTFTIGVGSAPAAIAVNPATGMVFVVNEADGTVSVINGATNAVMATISTGHSPVAVAANSGTNQVYVANRDDNTLTILNGATLATSSVAVGTMPVAVAVNPVDNSVYVVNEKSNSLTVVNGNTGGTTTVAVGATPVSVAVNPTTDVVYVVNQGGSTVTALNRKTSSATTIPVGSAPASIAINPLTNEIYVPSPAGGTVSVIDGATNTTSTVTVGVHPLAIAVNTLTNKIYVANSGVGETGLEGNLLSVIDGATKAVTELTGSGGSVAIALDPKVNRIYVPDTISGAAVAIVGATNTMKSIPTGVTGTPNLNPGDYGIAFNPVTGVMFLCDSYANSLILIDTATDTTTAVPVGNTPSWVAVNPVTNMAYVINAYDTKVSVVDGNSKTVVASIPTPYLEASAITVNPVTNKIYVAVGNSNEVIVIDGATNDTTVVPVGVYPISIAVNPVTNKIYIVNEGSGTLSILDGSADTITATLSIPIGVVQILVNPNTNTLYMPAPASAAPGAALLVVNGATNQMSTVTLSSSNSLAQQIALNLQTNRIYADWLDSSRGTVSSSIGTIDGTTDKLVGLTTVPLDVAVISTLDQLSNQVYAASYTNNNYSVLAIDGATDAFATIPTPNAGGDMAVNPANGKVYLTAGNTNIGVITPNSLQQIPLTMSVSGVTDSQTISTTNLFQTTNPSPTFTAQVTSSYTSTSGSSATVNPPPTSVYYQVDGGAYSWTGATPTSSAGSNPASFNVCLTDIPVGLHTLYLFPAYGDESAGSGAGNGTAGAVQVGNIQGVPFLIAPGGTSSGNSSVSCASSRSGSGSSNETAITVVSSVDPQVYGSSVTFTTTVAPLVSSAGTPSGAVTFYDGTTNLGTVALSSALTATYSTSSLSIGSHSITAAYSGNSIFAGSASGILVETIVAPTTIATTTTLSSSANPQVVDSSVTFTATVSESPAGSVAPTGTVSFFDGAAKLGTSALTSNLTATFVTSSLALGSHSITASYSGDTNFSGSTSGVLVESIVQPTPTATATTISSSANPQALGASVTFTATVKPSSSAAPSPTGSVEFFDGATALGKSNLTSNLTATYTTSSLALGNHSITAAYSGDTNFATSTSAVLTESIEESITSGDFTLTANPVSLTIISGKSGTVTLTAAPVGGFQGTINLACVDVLSNISCSFQAQSLTLNNSSPQSAVLTFSATNPTAQLRNPAVKGQSPAYRSLLAACFLPGCGLGMLLIVPTGKLRRRMTRLGALVVLLGVAFAIGGCGVTFNGYPETYNVVVSGSANGGQITHQVTVTLTVQN